MHTSKNIWLTLLAAAILVISAGARAAESGDEQADKEESSGKVLVEVNDEKITQEELGKYADFLFSTRRTGALTEREREQVREQTRREALKQLIARRLFVQAAEKEFFSEERMQEALDTFVEEQVNRFEQDLGSPIAMRQFLSQQDVTREEFLKMRRESMLVQEYFRQKVEPDIYVPPRKKVHFKAGKVLKEYLSRPRPEEE